MSDLSAGTILVHGIILSIGLSVILLGGMYLNPRLMQGDYPKEIQAQLPPLTNTDKRQRVIMGLVFYIFLLVVLLYSNAQLIARTGDKSFLPIFLNTYLVFEIFNIVDLFIIDYFVTMVLKPRALFIPGVEHLERYNTFRFHFRGFLIGLVVGVIVSLVVSVISLVLL